MDPNWFYSTLAQSTAAIVGLAAAFLASRLVMQRDEITRLREPLRRQLRQFATAVIEEWNLAKDVEDKATAAIARASETGDPSAAAGLELCSFSHPDEPSPYAAPNMSNMLALAGLATDARAVRESLPDVGGPPSQATLEGLEGMLAATLSRDEWESFGEDWSPYGARVASWLSGPVPDGPGVGEFFEELPNERQHAARRWAQLSDRWITLRSGTYELRSRVVPRSLFGLLAVLALLLSVGGIVPLTYLSAQPGSSKTWLIVGFAVLSLSVLLFLAVEIGRLRGAADLSDSS